VFDVFVTLLSAAALVGVTYLATENVPLLAASAGSPPAARGPSLVAARMAPGATVDRPLQAQAQHTKPAANGVY
jgi:hypothetical protein